MGMRGDAWGCHGMRGDAWGMGFWGRTCMALRLSASKAEK